MQGQGLDVTIDQYPYTASSTTLSTLLPDWILADGADSMRIRLSNKQVRKETIAYMLQKLQKRKLNITVLPMLPIIKRIHSFNGKTITQINILLGNKSTAASEAETILQMMEKGGASMVFHGIGEDDVKNIMQYPFNMFASDASIRIFGKGVPHPRGYGTNARVLSKYVREEKLMSLEEAIRRMTSLPAQKFQLKHRGLLQEGFVADIVIFDEKEVKDLSTFDKPHQYSKGFRYVFVNGKLTVDNGVHNGTRAGQNLKHIIP